MSGACEVAHACSRAPLRRSNFRALQSVLRLVDPARNVIVDERQFRIGSEEPSLEIEDLPSLPCEIRFLSRL